MYMGINKQLFLYLFHAYFMLSSFNVNDIVGYLYSIFIKLRINNSLSTF